jgi:hypothetical protein
MAKDLSVDLGEDRPGMLAKAAEALAAAKINIEGFSEAAGQMHLLVNSPARAKTALAKAGFKVTGERDVIVEKLVNRPGTAGRLLRRLADAGVNIEFSYVATGTRLVAAVSDMKAAQRAARKR